MRVWRGLGPPARRGRQPLLFAPSAVGNQGVPRWPWGQSCRNPPTQERPGRGVKGGLWAGGGGAGGQGAEMELSGGADPTSRALRARPLPHVERGSEQGRGRGGRAAARLTPVRGGRWAEGQLLRHTWARALSGSLCLTDVTWLTPRSGLRSRLHSPPGANSPSQGHSDGCSQGAHCSPKRGRPSVPGQLPSAGVHPDPGHVAGHLRS